MEPKRADFRHCFVIPGVCYSVKNSKQIIRNRRTGLPQIISNKNSREWITGAKNQLRHIWGSREPLDCPLHVVFMFYLPDRRRRDLHNLIHGPADALERGGVIKDDALIYSLDGSRKILDPDFPRTEIIVKPFNA